MDGSNVFHYCCRGRGDEGSLRILLKELSNGTKWKQQVLSKLLLLRNKEGKTSLHVACENGREDLVSTFLSLCSNSLLSKMLSTTDVSSQTPLLAAVASNSTDVVTCLIMWRGNNNRNLWKKASQIPYGDTKKCSGLVEKGQESSSPPCALVWAAKNGVIDMIHVLLQFSSVSGSDYRVTEALAAVIQSKASDEDKSESARILILAGGNAFADSVVISSASASSTTTPISVASNYGATRILQTLVQAGREDLKAKQQLRRRHPKLQQQPESFFRGIETGENSQ
jgi:ankyrin repeat protein